MKVLKWLAISISALALLVGAGVVALVYLVDWNNYRDTIKARVEAETGRTLDIKGDLDPSVFPWAGISVGEIVFGNAEGFGDAPFARIDSADVKVELLPLLRRNVNVRTVTLNGLELDLQRSANGTNNWDDLVDTPATAVTSEEGEDDSRVTTEVEGSQATIAALALGGIEVTDANVAWRDAEGGTDARLSDFNLVTGAIELVKPFDLSVDFSVASDSMDLAADMTGNGEVTIDLNRQTYSLAGFTLNTAAKGSALPGGTVDASLRANVLANLGEQRIDVSDLNLETLGLVVAGEAEVTQLDTEARVRASLASETFSPRKLIEALAIELPPTADESVLGEAGFTASLVATPASATLDDLVVTLDDTTFRGKASVPNLATAAAVPPLRFDFAVDEIDVDRYLPPPSDADASDEAAPADNATGDATGDASDETSDASTTTDGDTPIALPIDLLRALDVNGVFRLGSVKVAGLTTRDIVVPLEAVRGRLAVDGLSAQLYEGRLAATARLDASTALPGYALDMSLEGIQADPLLAALLEKDSFLSGEGRVAANVTTRGDTVNTLKAGLDGTFDTAFEDGSINGINLGYQLRRAKAALSGNKLSNEEKNVKTDFSSLTVGGRFDNGVMTSTDLDMRSPLLRVNGAGTVDLPGEAVDYTLTTLVTGTAQGQGGAELDSLKGVKLDIPIRGSFDDLANDFAGVMFRGLKDNITGNLSNQAKELAREKAAKLKAQAAEELKAQEAAARERLEVKQAELEEKADKAKDKLEEKAREQLKGFLK